MASACSRTLIAFGLLRAEKGQAQASNAFCTVSAISNILSLQYIACLTCSNTITIKLCSTCLPAFRNLFLETLTHSASNFSVLAQNNVTNGNKNAASQNLFVHFVTTRFNMSSSDATKMLKWCPTLERLKTLDNVQQVVSTLERYGCTKDQIARIIRKQPSLLVTSAETVLEPKIQLLKGIGMAEEKGIQILTRFPYIMASKLEKLRSNFELLKTVFPAQDVLMSAISKSPKILQWDLKNLYKPSVAFWEDFGIRGTDLTKFFYLNPSNVICSSLSPEQLDLIRRIGVQKESKMYKYIVSMVAGSATELLEARMHNLQLCGLSLEETLQVVRGDPSVLVKTRENVKKKMDFMLNHMELSVDFVVKHPRMFTMSVDTVMRPRFSVLQSMKAINGGEINPTRLFYLLTMTEAKFVGLIIEGHPESAALWTIYRNAIADVSKTSKTEI